MMTNLVNLTRLMEHGIYRSNDLEVSDYGDCGEEKCGGNCTLCGKSIYNNV